eukprot:TRINITY_DN838_c0_g1_i6.p1 TRINITY_DN838_c0_g1~~TRINITY_DN838_c0_g1_i6.p1  ORF type:complete len:477 (-),score=88.92 TRINITY_DN838_c0_g1_i6:765-2195(-)
MKRGPLLLLVLCFTYVISGEAAVEKDLKLGSPDITNVPVGDSLKVASGAILEFQRFALGWHSSLTSESKNAIIAQIYSREINNQPFSDTRNAYLGDDKDIYKDVKLFFEKKPPPQSKNFASYVAISPSYLLVGMPNLPLQKKEASGVAYFYQINSDKSLEFLRSFNTTPTANRKVGRSVAISENYAAVSRDDNKIQTFILFNGEWKEQQLIKTAFETSSLVSMEIQGHNLHMYHTNDNNITLQTYFFDGEWVPKKALDLQHLSDNTLTATSFRGQDVLMALSAFNQTTRLSLVTPTNLPVSESHTDLPADDHVFSLLFTSSEVLMLVRDKSNPPNIQFKRYALNSATNPKNRDETLYVMDAFYNTEDARHFKSYDFIEALNGPFEVNLFEIQYYRQYYFRTTIFCRYLLSNSAPLDLTGQYNETYVYASFRSGDNSLYLKSGTFDHHNEGVCLVVSLLFSRPHFCAYSTLHGHLCR